MNSSRKQNLVPSTPSTTPNYWCTWTIQNFAAQRTIADHEVWDTPQGAELARIALDEDRVFGPDGWLRDFFPKVRNDLLVVFDDGWDVPRKDWDPHFGSVELFEPRFPSCTGTPEERLRKLNAKVRELGWRGTGLWIACQEATRYFSNGNITLAQREAYWRERLRWCHVAGIAYWKVDWGKQNNAAFRQFQTRIGKEVAPGLIIEHVLGAGPFNDMKGTCRTPLDELDRMAERLAFSDAFRTYDVSGPLSVPSTLDRVAGLMARAHVNHDALGLVHCEDEVYMAAILGCVMGVMRYPVGDLPAGVEPNIHLGGGERFSGTRPIRKQMDEVVRAVRWQRIAPAFKPEASATNVDSAVLWDSWAFRRFETWLREAAGGVRKQGAPARVSRGMPLPMVSVPKGSEPPYALATRYPSGAVSVGTLGRVTPEKGYHVPLADITADIGNAAGPIGIFGLSKSVTLRFDRDITNSRVFAQDLAGDVADDITDRISIAGRQLTVPGEVISSVGLSARSSLDDGSEPGMVMAIVCP